MGQNPSQVGIFFRSTRYYVPFSEKSKRNEGKNTKFLTQILVDWQKKAFFLWLFFVQSLFAGEKTPKDVSVQELLAQGLSPKLVAQWKAKANQSRESFFEWKRSLAGNDAKLVSKVWKVLHLSYPKAQKSELQQGKPTQKEFAKVAKGNQNPSQTSETKVDEVFVGLSTQNLDVRNLPLEEKNHSAVSIGGNQNGNRYVLEKRDEQFLYGIDLNLQSYRITSGSRYKPIPHFYFDKDPNFYSQLDRPGSPLPQPIQSSHFFGTQFPYEGKKGELGGFFANGFSHHPGIYFSSPNNSYAGVWSPGGQKSSFFVNDTIQLDTFGNHRIQSETIFDKKESVGFLYTKSESKDSVYFFDSTVYRDSPLLYGNVANGEIRPEIPQTLGYARGSYKHLFGGEGLSSQEGHRYETGSSVFFPMFASNWGNLLYRYRKYNETGNYHFEEIGRGVFYEWRKDKTVISLGFESRERGGQWEGKIAIPISSGQLIELSALFREGQLYTRSWFENWTYASDFNINLSDREEILKLKFVSSFLSLNVSYSKREESPNPILFINFQFLHRMEI
ncbi:hypothetical protein LEP1GSC202_2059 [Leptospira yanagawae serovar Saopaulo str. Sao Paulo = ATCC 700523]|uniref:Uncharacterized protein n=1 Tax=Leptospira yanagawae serovar Saopaulo str. Sao Paulo = ATCC 700523 TaxID=1249483 RepID=A0A5E8H947_9LEPT|nr:hypothetical protein LEP1GSC202_2059 [Leptospira yanagawae serovar Saopaulo str. Sao Paulo = ATCC 700523]